MPWWQQNPDEHFLGVKKRQYYPMPQARVQQVQPRQIIIKQINSPRMRQSQTTKVSNKTINRIVFKPFFKRAKETASAGLEKTENITEKGANRIREIGYRAKQSTQGVYQPRGIIEKIKYALRK